MTTERRFDAGMRETETDTPGLVLGDDGVVYLVHPDGTRTTVGGGGSVPVNWCLIGLTPPVAPLTVASPTWAPHLADYSITAQSGTDFSLVSDGGGFGHVASAAGGMFQCGGFLGDPEDATLDAGSSRTRYLSLSASVGDGGTSPLNSLGLDMLLPIVSGTSICFASVPGIVAPGGTALGFGNFAFVNAFGTDSVPLDQVVYPGFFGVWQIA